MKKTIKINLILLAVISILLGVAYMIIGIISDNNYFLYVYEWGTVMTVFGVGFIWIGTGLITKNLLKDSKGSFFLGFFLSVIGIIIAVIIRLINNTSSKSTTSKYDELEKLQKLKEEGILTIEEFEKEKEKLLK